MNLTTGERSALRWLTAVAVLGAGAQLVQHWRHSVDATPLSTEALAMQLVAVDSAQRAGRHGRGRGAGRSTARPTARSTARTDSLALPTLGPVDLDRADSALLERLPRIGPALAARIVADRQTKGPFGSLHGFERVRGIGPKLAQSLTTLVTFSGIPRPSPVQR